MTITFKKSPEQEASSIQSRDKARFFTIKSVRLRYMRVCNTEFLNSCFEYVARFSQRALSYRTDIFSPTIESKEAMKIGATLTEAHIITIPDLGTNTANNQILWSVVVEDASRRFSKGDFCRISLIQHISSDIVVTACSPSAPIGLNRRFKTIYKLFRGLLRVNRRLSRGRFLPSALRSENRL